MICPMCTFEFDEDAAVKACRTCTVFGGCQKVRCPQCGYESPRETRLVRWVRGLLARRHQAAQQDGKR